MTTPQIKRAIPLRRYQLGGFLAHILSEIESDDPVQYHYIMALQQEGDEHPSLYVACIQTPPNQADKGRYRLRVMTEHESRDMNPADQWGELETFALGSMGIAAKLYQLGDEEPKRLS